VSSFARFLNFPRESYGGGSDSFASTPIALQRRGTQHSACDVILACAWAGRRLAARIPLCIFEPLVIATPIVAPGALGGREARLVEVEADGTEAVLRDWGAMSNSSDTRSSSLAYTWTPSGTAASLRVEVRDATRLAPSRATFFAAQKSGDSLGARTPLRVLCTRLSPAHFISPFVPSLHEGVQ